MAVARHQQIGGDVGAYAEQPGMAERYQSGIANQDVEPEGENRVKQDLAGNIDIIDFADRVRQHSERDEGDQRGKAAAENELAHRIWPPNRPCGRNTKTSTIGRNRMK